MTNEGGFGYSAFYIVQIGSIPKRRSPPPSIFEGWRFDPRDIKYFHPTSAVAKLGAKLRMMQAAVAREEAETGECRRCHQPMPPDVRARLAKQDDWGPDAGDEGEGAEW